MSSNMPSGHCSGTNICSNSTSLKSAHLRLASTRGVGAASTAITVSHLEAKVRRQNANRAANLKLIGGCEWRSNSPHL